MKKIKTNKGQFKIQKCVSDSLNCKEQFKINKFANFRLLNCRSQFKIQQTMFMILGIAIFFMMIFVFYIGIKSSSLKNQASSLAEDKAILMTEYISGTTEFACKKQYCIDTDRLMVLKNISSYNEFFGNAIQIRKIYPQDKDVECTPANYPNCTTYTIKSGGNSSVGSFVALCRHDKINGESKQICELGRIAVGYKIV